MKISSRQISKVAGEAEAKRSSSSNFNYKYSQSKIMNFLKLAEVFGAEAVVYHGSRSPPEEFLNILKTENFKPGENGGYKYGKGLYTVYNLNQDKGGGFNYGTYIYKLKVNLYGFISFNPDITQKIYGKDLVPSEQYSLFGTNRRILSSLKDLDSRHREVPSSGVAEDASIFLKGKVKGIIYTGETDGDCAAIYDAGTVIPLGWRMANESDWKSFGDGSKSFIGRGIAGNFKEGIYGDAYTPELNPRFIHFLETLSSEDLKDPRLSVRIKPFIERVARENPYDFLRRFAERDWAAPYIIGAAKSCSQKELETLLENFEENDLAKPYMHAVIKVFVEKSLYSLLLLFSKKEWANKPVESLKGKTWVEFVAKTLAEEDPIYFFENFSGEAWAKDYLSVARYALSEKDPRYFFENFSGEAWAKDYLSVARDSLAKKNPYYLLVNFYEIEDWADSYITEEFLNRALNDRFYVENFLDNHAKESWTQKKLERLGRKSILDIAIQTYDKLNGLSEFLENYSKRAWAKPYLGIAAEDLSKNSPLTFLKTYSEMEWAKSYVTEEVIMRAFKEEDDLMEFIYSFSERDWAKKPVESLEGKTWIEFAEGKLAERNLKEQKNASQNSINTKLIKLAKALKFLGLHDDCRMIKSLNRN